MVPCSRAYFVSACVRIYFLTTLKMKTTSKMKTISKMKTTSKKDNFKNLDDLKNEDFLKNEDDLKKIGMCPARAYTTLVVLVIACTFLSINMGMSTKTKPHCFRN